MKRFFPALLLFALFTGCMTNRVFHAGVASDWGRPVPRTVRVTGVGVLSDRLLVSLHKGCPALSIRDSDADLRLLLSVERGESLSLSCYREPQGTLLFSRSWIITRSSGKAINAIFHDFATRLDAELRKRFPGFGRGGR